MALFNVVADALRRPSPLASYSMLSFQPTSRDLLNAVSTALQTTEAAFLALRVREWTLRGRFVDASTEELIHSIEESETTQEILDLTIHIVSKYYGIGVYVDRGDQKPMMTPSHRHEVCVRLVWSKEHGFSASRCADGYTCHTPFE